jgi:HSP20 family protein
MNDPFRHLERLERELGDIAFNLTRVQFSYFRVPEYWRPAINAYRCADHFVVCVDLAGVEKRVLSVRAEPHRLVISGTRPPPEPVCNEPDQAVTVMAMEINYGAFERVLDLPSEVDPERVTAEHREGLLWIHLPLQVLS